MFNKLTDFGYKRSAKEAVGFYLTYMALCLVVVMAVGPFLQPNHVSESELMALMIEFQKTNVMSEALRSYIEKVHFYAALFSVTLSAALSVVIAKKKGIFEQPKTLAIIIAIVTVAYITSPLISLIPIAWLTTK